MKLLLLSAILSLSLYAKTVTICDLETGECRIVYVYGDDE